MLFTMITFHWQPLISEILVLFTEEVLNDTVDERPLTCEPKSVVVLSVQSRFFIERNKSPTVTGREECPQILRNVIAGQDRLSYHRGSYANGVMGKLVFSGERRDTAGPES